MWGVVREAGNEGQKYCQGAWRDLDGNGFLEFGGGSTELLPIGAPAGGSQVVLRWDDGFGLSNHDYDLLIDNTMYLIQHYDPTTPL